MRVNNRTLLAHRTLVLLYAISQRCEHHLTPPNKPNRASPCRVCRRVRLPSVSIAEGKLKGAMRVQPLAADVTRFAESSWRSTRVKKDLAVSGAIRETSGPSSMALPPKRCGRCARTDTPPGGVARWTATNLNGPARAATGILESLTKLGPSTATYVGVQAARRGARNAAPITKKSPHTFLPWLSRSSSAKRPETK